MSWCSNDPLLPYNIYQNISLVLQLLLLSNTHQCFERMLVSFHVCVPNWFFMIIFDILNLKVHKDCGLIREQVSQVLAAALGRCCHNLNVHL